MQYKVNVSTHLQFIIRAVSVTSLYVTHTDLRLHTTLSVNVYLKQYTCIMNRISRMTVIYQLNFFSYKKSCEIWVKSKITIPYDLTPYSLVDRYKHFRGTWCNLLKLLVWSWRQQDSMKCWYLSTKVQGLTFHKTYSMMQCHTKINFCEVHLAEISLRHENIKVLCFKTEGRLSRKIS